MPKSACDERRHTGAEAGFLAFGRHSQVYVVPEPVIRVDVPVAQICMAVLRELHARRLDIRQTVPIRSACPWVKSLVANTRQNTGSLSESPDAVEFHARDEAHHMKVIDAPEEAHVPAAFAQHDFGSMEFGKLQEDKNPS